MAYPERPGLNYSQPNQRQQFGSNMPTFGGNMPTFGGNAPQQNNLLQQMKYNQGGGDQFEQGRGLRGGELEERIRQFNMIRENQGEPTDPYEQSRGFNKDRFNEARSNFMNMFKDPKTNPFSSYYNYPKAWGEAPVEQRWHSDPSEQGAVPPWIKERLQQSTQGSQPSLEERALNQRASNPPARNNWGY